MSVDLGVTARKTDDAGPGQLKKFGVDAAEGAPCADKRHIALGNKITDGLRDRFIGIGGEVSLALGKLLCHSRVLPRERAVNVEEADIAVLVGWAGDRGGRGGGYKSRLEAHDLVKMLFNAGNGDADDHLGGLARNDEALAPAATNDALSATMEGSATSTRRRVAQLVAPAILPTPPKS